jgi:DNA (cytosine-5)-methyltransferase 1
MALKYIDLFAGCGGLSLGLKRAGFELTLAVEKSDMAAETYYHNFIQRLDGEGDWNSFLAKGVEEQYEEGLVVNSLSEVLGNDALMEKLAAEDVDLVAGGPPCQGFSLAGRRNPHDVRNRLPWEFIEMVERTAPKAVLMENVAGIRQRFEKHGQDSPFEQLKMALEQAENGHSGYLVQPVLLNAKHFGVAQHRPRVMLLGIRRDLATLADIDVSDTIWKSEFGIPNVEPIDCKSSMVPKVSHYDDSITTVSDAISDLSPYGYREDEGDEISAYSRTMRSNVECINLRPDRGNETVLKNHNLRNHSEKIKDRFRLYHVFQEYGLPRKILGIPASSEMTQKEIEVTLNVMLAKVQLPCEMEDGKKLANSLEELVQLTVALKTRKHSQRPLIADQPSPTVLSIPDDFIHPWESRTMTVREMARFQSFPDAFEFRSKETTGSDRRRFEVPQYTQVGNAVPPLMAEAVGDILAEVLAREDTIETMSMG